MSDTERERELARSNYATQLEGLGYDPSGNPSGNPSGSPIVKNTSMNDNVNHPSHYTQGGIECIKAIEASMSPDGFQDYCKGNVMKYIWRWRDKAGVEDLKKAQVYLNWLIESAEKDKPKDAFVHDDRADGKKLKIEYVEVDPSSLGAGAREYYFHCLANDLRICSASRGCSKCERGLTENGCNMLESDAADAIEFLLKELEEKKNAQTPTEK